MLLGITGCLILWIETVRAWVRRSF
jgi:hypothetical protein